MPSSATPAPPSLPHAAIVFGDNNTCEWKMGNDLAIGDLNGDGVDELIVDSFYQVSEDQVDCPGEVLIFNGPLEPTTATEKFWVRIPETPEHTYWLTRYSAEGDTDGDQVVDLAVVCWIVETQSYELLIYRGLTAGVMTREDADLVIPDGVDLGSVGALPDMVSDFDGDGNADILTGYRFGDDPIDGSHPGAAYLLSTQGSGRVPFEEALIATFVGEEEGDDFGQGFAAVGDTNGDGVSEVVIGAPNADYAETGRAYLFSSPFNPTNWARNADATLIGEFGDYECIFWGGRSPPHMQPPHPDGRAPEVYPCPLGYYPDPYGSWAGEAVYALGDVNGDAIPDYSVYSGYGVHNIVDGSLRGRSELMDSMYRVGRANALLASADDLDHNGRADFFHSRDYREVDFCRPLGQPGTEGDTLRCDLIYSNPGTNSQFRAMAAGDLTGDGLMDLAIGYPDMIWEGAMVGGVIVLSGADILAYVQGLDALRAGAAAPEPTP